MDERLRKLERDAQVDPASARERVRALEQAGDRRGAWALACRLAREGDASMWDVIERRPRGVREPPSATTRRDLSGSTRLVGDDGALVAAGMSQTVVLDPQDLTERASLSVGTATQPVLCGPYFAFAPREPGASVRIIDGHGVVVAASDLSRTPSSRVRHLVATADRVVAWVNGHDLRPGHPTCVWPIAIEAGRLSPLAALNPLHDQLMDPQFAIGHTLLGDDGTGVVALELTGAVRWRRADCYGPVTADPQGALVWDGLDGDLWDDPDRPTGLFELRLRTGDVQWRREDLLASARLALMPEVAVHVMHRAPEAGYAATWADEPVRVTAIDRSSGALRWTFERPMTDRHAVLDVAFAEDTLYVSVARVDARSVPRRLHDGLTLALDLATGRALFELPLEGSLGAHDRSLITLIPLDRSLVVARRNASGMVVERYA